jgi:hypothetical protein
MYQNREINTGRKMLLKINQILERPLKRLLLLTHQLKGTFCALHVADLTLRASPCLCKKMMATQYLIEISIITGFQQR